MNKENSDLIQASIIILEIPYRLNTWLNNVYKWYFTEIVDKLTRNLPSSDNIHLFNLVPYNNNIIHFFVVTQMGIYTVIMKLKDQSCHLNDVSIKILKSVFIWITYMFEIIFNKCIQDGIHPNLLKYARVKSIYISGERSEVSNYRPINNLLSFKKFLNGLKGLLIW